jgi:hypothetical protein
MKRGTTAHTRRVKTGQKYDAWVRIEAIGERFGPMSVLPMGGQIGLAAFGG